MVDITDFFGKKKPKRTATTSEHSSNAIPGKRKPSTVPATKQEIINIDDDEDDDDLLQLGKRKRKPEIISLDSPSPKAVKKLKAPVNEDMTPTKKKISSSPLKKSEPVNIDKKENKDANKIEAVTTHNELSSGAKLKSAIEVLATIPDVDLDDVHVKENAKFAFGQGAAPTDGEISAPADFPEGAPNCLLGLTFVFTGVLPTLERSVSENIAKRYGARVTKSISSKTSVVVLGEDAGPKKLEKIKQHKIKTIDEDGFRMLIESMPPAGGSGELAEKARQKLKEEEEKTQREVEDMVKEEQTKASRVSKAKNSGETINKNDLIREEDKLWTVKYAPTKISQLCGNKGVIAKLENWLLNWEKNKSQNFKQYGSNGTGIYRAVMLSGPPGIGKTTAAHLVARQFGYDVLEQNASDVRSKSLLNAGVKNAIGNMSVVGFFLNKDNIEDINGKKFVIIMDEVDGMSGGDRGGVGQLAQYCRTTNTPMILICNERRLPKLRPFDKVCLDLPFRRPDSKSVKARLMTIAVREGFKLDPNVIDRLVQATGGDIRQIINLLSTVSTTTKTIDHYNIRQISDAWQKNVALKPFDITSKLFNGQIYTDLGSQTFNLNDKIGLYFDDFDFTPLMVQENYLACSPTNLPAGKTPLDAIADAAESISLGDLIERKIRSTEQLWSLLPLHGVLSSVRPASMVAGRITGRINFTGWLGQNSRSNKYYRLLQELQYHTKLRTSTDKIGFRLDYLPTLKDRLLLPLVKEGSDGISEVIEVMDMYYLTKEDWDTIMEFMIGTAKTDIILKKIPTTVKSAFTRIYNKTTHPVAIYKTGTSIATKSAAATSTPDFEDIVDADDTVQSEPEDNNESNDIKKDKLIKQKAKPTKRKTTTTKKAVKKRKA